MWRPMPKQAWAPLFLTLLLLAACDGQEEKARPGHILIVGDSLTAGYGLNHPENDAWPALVEEEWASSGFLAPDQHIINAGISGDTSAGGLERLPDLLAEHQPGTVIIALGSNDIKRQTATRTLEHNLGEMTRQAQATGATVLLVGVDLPTPLALAARGQPNQSISKLAEQYSTEMATIPLDEISSDGDMLPDQIHPGLGGQVTIQEALEPAIRKAASARNK